MRLRLSLRRRRLWRKTPARRHGAVRRCAYPAGNANPSAKTKVEVLMADIVPAPVESAPVGPIAKTAVTVTAGGVALAIVDLISSAISSHGGELDAAVP